MMTLTPTALSKLKALILEHPEDPIVRLVVRDVDETHIGLSITLVSDPESEDEVREYEGLTLAVAQVSWARLDGVALDYLEPQGFRFLHPDNDSGDLLKGMNLN